MFQDVTVDLSLESTFFENFETDVILPLRFLWFVDFRNSSPLTTTPLILFEYRLGDRSRGPLAHSQSWQEGQRTQQLCLTSSPFSKPKPYNHQYAVK